jgi:hypothetical protein
MNYALRQETMSMMPKHCGPMSTIEHRVDSGDLNDQRIC